MTIRDGYDPPALSEFLMVDPWSMINKSQEQTYEILEELPTIEFYNKTGISITMPLFIKRMHGSG